MILSVSNIAWVPEERLEAYAAMGDAGVDGLEIAPALFFPQSADPFRPNADEARRATGEIAAAGLRLVSMQSLLFGVDGAGLFEEPDARARFYNGMERAIGLAGQFGIPNLVFGSPRQRRIPEGKSPEQARAEAVRVFRMLGDRAVAAGTAITIESNPSAYGTNFLNTLTEAEAFVTEVAHPGIRLILDLGSMAMNGEAATTAARVPALAPLLNHVHVSEPHLAPAPASSRELASVLKALDAAGYSLAVSIEMKRPESGIEELRQCLGKLREAREL
jgi:sugar phosphate isomerase/epimerase